MNLIFGYLPFHTTVLGTLHVCSMVNSHWLYYIWNTSKFIYPHSNIINSIIEETTKLDPDMKKNEFNNHGVIRAWQRLVHHTKITIWLTEMEDYIVPNSLLLGRLSMLGNIKELSCLCTIQHESIAKVLIQQCKDKLERCSIGIGERIVEPKLKVLELMNAWDIKINNMYFYIKWSKECIRLILSPMVQINQEWCNYVIENCDCSGITHVIMSDLLFGGHDGSIVMAIKDLKKSC